MLSKPFQLKEMCGGELIHSDFSLIRYQGEQIVLRLIVSACGTPIGFFNSNAASGTTTPLSLGD
jgi:hypothetical protein